MSEKIIEIKSSIKSMKSMSPTKDSYAIDNHKQLLQDSKPYLPKKPKSPKKKLIYVSRKSPTRPKMSTAEELRLQAIKD